MPKHAFVLLLFVGFGLIDDINGEFRKTFSKSCDKSYTLTCFKLDVVGWVDKLNNVDGYSVLPGVSFVRDANSSADVNSTETVANLAREFPNDPDARLDAFLLKKVSGFINDHSIKLKLWNENTVGASARKGSGGFGGGGGKGGKGGDGGLGMLLAAGAMMKGTLMAVALAGLAAIAGKALMASLIALMLAALSGLKGMGGGGKTTYEVVAKPVYTSSSSHSVSHEDYGHGHSGYGRSFSQSLPLGLQNDYDLGH